MQVEWGGMSATCLCVCLVRCANGSVMAVMAPVAVFENIHETKE